MKRKCYILLPLLLLVVMSYAQPPKNEHVDGRERIEQQIRYYSGVFSLNSEQSEQFGSLYKEYSKKLFAIKREFGNSRPESHSALTDEQIEKRILDNFALSRGILDVREEYYKKFREVLTPSQISTIYEDEKGRRAHVNRH